MEQKTNEQSSNSNSKPSIRSKFFSLLALGDKLWWPLIVTVIGGIIVAWVIQDGDRFGRNVNKTPTSEIAYPQSTAQVHIPSVNTPQANDQIPATPSETSLENAVIASIGTFCFGLIIGYLTRFFMHRFNVYSSQTLFAVIATIFIGILIVPFTKNTFLWWFYPIGIFFGFVVWTTLALIFPNKEGVVYCEIPYDKKATVMSKKDKEPDINLSTPPNDSFRNISEDDRS